MKQTQNQYYGKRKDMPNKLPPGSIYMSSDEDTLYHSREDGIPLPFKTSIGEEFYSNVINRVFGWQDFADTATTLSPIIQSNINGGEVELTNNNNDTLTDGNTNSNLETTAHNVNDIWDTSSNTIIFKDTGLEKNDVIDVRVHLKVNSRIIDQSFSVRIDFYDQPNAQGTNVFHLRKQIYVETLSAGVFRENMVTLDFFLGESILNGSAKIILEGTKSFEVEVIGFNFKIKKIAR